MNTHRRRTLTLLSAAALALAISAPAHAQQLPGPGVRSAKSSCPLERIGAQLVRCDRLTGNGVSAPLYIPEQR